MFAGHCEWATLFITDPRTGPLTPWVGGRICLVPAGDRVGWGGGRHVTNPPFSIPPRCRFPPDFPKFFNYIYIYNSTFVRSNSKSCDQGEGGRREKNDTVSNIISGIDSLTTYSAACDNVISEMTHETRKYTECTMSLSYHWRIAWRYIYIYTRNFIRYFKSEQFFQSNDFFYSSTRVAKRIRGNIWNVVGGKICKAKGRPTDSVGLRRG